MENEIVNLKREILAREEYENYLLARLKIAEQKSKECEQRGNHNRYNNETRNKLADNPGM